LSKKRFPKDSHGNLEAEMPSYEIVNIDGQEFIKLDSSGHMSFIYARIYTEQLGYPEI